MSWRYRFPDSSDYESEEEYNEAVEAYYDAADDYADAYRESRYER